MRCRYLAASLDPSHSLLIAPLPPGVTTRDVSRFCQVSMEAKSASKGSASGSVCVCVHAQLCPSLCDPMDCSPPGSSAHGILQARILE